MSDYFNLNDYPKEIKEKTARIKKFRFNFNKKILTLILIAAIGIPTTVILSQQNQDNRQYASTTSNQIRLTDIEAKVAGIEANGKLNEEKAEEISKINRKGYEQLVREGLIVNPEEIEKETAGSRMQELNTTSVNLSSIVEPNIDSCGEIITSGNYSVTKDLSQDEESCIYIHDTSDVNIDCNNYLISAQTNQTYRNSTISVENVQNFSIKNCRIDAISTVNSGKNALSINILNGSVGLIQNNIVLNGFINISDSNQLEFDANTIAGVYQQNYTSFTSFHDNKVTAPLYLSAAVWISNDGTNNTIKDNFFDGSWDGKHVSDIESYIGADDGVIISQEDGTVISGNTINNNWDCGIESLGLIQNTQIINNKINNSGLCGIGAWYWNSWLNNNISSNVIDKAGYAFFIFRALDLDENHNEQIVYFKDNNFSDNLFKNRTKNSYLGNTGPYSSYINFSNLELPVKLENNTFKNNDFDNTVLEPYIGPASIIVDQGGNKCLSFQDSYSRPLTCVGQKVNKITIFPEADAFVRKDQPTKNFGKLAYLQTDVNPATISYLRFNLSSLEGKKIIGAQLNLKSKNVTGYNQYLQRVDNAFWKENQINFNNKPGATATIVGFFATKANQNIKLEVLNAVKSSQGKNLNLRIKSGDNKISNFYSRESRNKPKLIIQYQD